MYTNVFYDISKNQMHEWFYDKNGERQHIIGEYKPYFFIETNEITKHKNLSGKCLKKLEFNNQNKFYETKDKYSDLQLYDSDYGHETKYLSDKYKDYDEIENIKYQLDFIDIEVDTSVTNVFPNPSYPDSPISIITVYRKEKFYTFAFISDRCKFTNEDLRKLKEDIKKTKDRVVTVYRSEEEMLKTFVKWWRKEYPDIVTGWNVVFFDIPYLVGRLKVVLGEKYANALSPINQIKEATVEIFHQEKIKYLVRGISIVDYLELYKTSSKSVKESYQLGFIAQEEIGETKVEYEGTLDEFYLNDFVKFIEYNIQDVSLIVKMNDKLKYMDIVINICYMCKVTFDFYNTTIAKLDAAFRTQCIRKGIYFRDKEEENEHFILGGGYVHEPQIGMHKMMITFDFSSLYPSIMRVLNLGPDTKQFRIEEKGIKPVILGLNNKEYNDEEISIYRRKVNKLKISEVVKILQQNNLTLSAYGVVYQNPKKKKGFMPEILEKWYNLRKKYKQEGKNNRQYALKILLNSIYGFMASPYSRFSDHDNAESITATGRELTKNNIAYINRWAQEKWTSTKLARKLCSNSKKIEKEIVVAGDTDSIMISLEPFFKSVNIDIKSKKADVIIKHLIDLIKRIFTKHIDKTVSRKFNSDVKGILSLEYENLADAAIYFKKKHYVKHVIDPKEDLIIKGIKLIRSDTPMFARNEIKKLVIEILKDRNREDIISDLRKLKKRFLKASVEQIAMPTSVTNVRKYIHPGSKVYDGKYVKGTPINARASILYNMMLRKYKVVKEYSGYIENGNKIRYLYLKRCPYFAENVIGFKEKLPKEFKLNEFVDKEKQWDKAVMSVIKNIFDALSWETPKDVDTVSIESVFS